MKEHENLVCPLMRSSLAAAATACRSKCCASWKVVILLPIKVEALQSDTGREIALICVIHLMPALFRGCAMCVISTNAELGVGVQGRCP